jgi:hypothetical protein
MTGGFKRSAQLFGKPMGLSLTEEAASESEAGSHDRSAYRHGEVGAEAASTKTIICV